VGGKRFAAIRFGSAEPLPSTVHAVYKLDINEYQGTSSLQLMIDHVD
jgi:single-stranded-DNA-specific exonuclease